MAAAYGKKGYFYHGLMMGKALLRLHHSWQKLEKGPVHLGASGSEDPRQNMFHVTLQPVPKIARASYSLNDPPL